MAIKRHKHFARDGERASRSYLGAGLGMLAIVVIIGIAAVMLSNNVLNITSAQTLNITNGGVVFRMAGSEYVAFLHGTSGSTAYVYITKTPVFVNQVLNVTLQNGITVHVNYGTSNANMALTLKSIGASAYVQIVPVSSSVGIAPDAGYIKVLPPTSLGGQPATVKINVNNTTDTIKATTSVTAVTTVPTVTSQVMQKLETTEYYPLMLNYSDAYAKTLQCSASQYDADYISQYGVAPSGATTYQNVSVMTPYNMSLAISQSSGDLYTATYSTKAKTSVGSGTVLTITINSTSGAVISTKFEGAFSSLDYTQLYNAYAKMKSVGDSCEAFFG